ncbi:MAG: GNAT family N-acetyltransferase [Chloroflexi bacterium]|nr:GNAT family N-acetyltransferase [Chloroflexota bacterium]|tara:strand:+ start:26061 stop:26522 length:462 start_codon:yes stop_codon:yes gene_type:complete
MIFTSQRIITIEEMDLALEIRRQVFIQEQGVDPKEEIDDFDIIEKINDTVIHVLVFENNKPIATGRLLLDSPENEYAHITRVAVLQEYRKKGAGRAVMLWLQNMAKQTGRNGITLAAQTHAIAFYEKLGYKTRGAIFLDANIEHRWMDLVFDN